VGFLATGFFFLTAGFFFSGFFFTATFLFGLALVFEAFLVPVFLAREPVLATPLAAFEAVAFFAAAAGANKRRGVPVRKVRRVWYDKMVGIVATRADAKPRQAAGVTRREAKRWVRSVNMIEDEFEEVERK
jgi:hypothetical protein